MVMTSKSGMIAILSGLAVGTATPCMSQTPPPPNAVVVAGNAPALCWSPAGTNWRISQAAQGNFTAGAGFSGGGTIAIPESDLVDTNKRANVTFAGGDSGNMRLRFTVSCNTLVVAQLSAQYGRLQNVDALTLPAGMPVARTANRSATFENYYPYRVDYGFVNTVNGAVPPGATDKVNGSLGYVENQAGSPAGGASPSWPSVTSGGDWFSIKRVDVRINLNPPPNVAGTTVRPVMIAGSYKDQLTLTLTPSL
jgi:hypothetical protein